jgi:hypothetical protein
MQNIQIQSEENPQAKTSVTALVSEDETSKKAPKFVHVLQDMLESRRGSLQQFL